MQKGKEATSEAGIQTCAVSIDPPPSSPSGAPLWLCGEESKQLGFLVHLVANREQVDELTTGLDQLERDHGFVWASLDNPR